MLKHPRECRRILVIKPSSLGDILHVFPALELLRCKYPEAQLDFLVHPAFAELLDYSPFPVSRRILFHRKRLGKLSTMIPEFFRLVRKLRRRRYDLVIDFQGLTRSALFGVLAKGGPVIGFANPREKAAALGYRYQFEVPPGHAVERNVNLLNAYWGETNGVPAPELRMRKRHMEKVAAELGTMPEELVVLLPGARWKTKEFPPELFAGVVRRIHEKRPGAVFATIGSGAEVEVERKIRELIGERVPFLALAGKTTLGMMMEVLRYARAAVCNDSGPMHAAAALNVPVFAFFGPTDPARTGPYGKGHKVYQLNMACVKCMKRRCPEEEPGCHRIDPETVANDVIEKLEALCPSNTGY